MKNYCCATLVVIVFVFVVYEIYRHTYPVFDFKKWWRGVIDNILYHKERNDKIKVKNKFYPSASLVREIVVCLFVILVAFWVLGFVLEMWNVKDFTQALWRKIHENFVLEYPLLTTIIGASIALLCDYFIIAPKIYVSPNAVYSLEKRTNNKTNEEIEKEIIKFYIENRSLFDCIDVHVEAYKCICTNATGDLCAKTIKLRVNEIAKLSGRWAASNDKSIVVSTYDIGKEWILREDVDYIEVVVIVTHALSRVTKVITQKYYREDIYKGVMENEKLISNIDTKVPTEIFTLRAGVLKRFMYARKFAEYSIFFTFLVMISKMIFETDDIIWFTSYSNTLIISGCILSILFSILRIVYKIPVRTNNDNENHVYRVLSEKDT